MHRRDDVRVETPPPAFSSRSPLFIAAVLSSSALFDSLSLYLSLSLSFSGRRQSAVKNEMEIEHTAFSLLKSNKALLRTKKKHSHHHAFVWVSLSLSLSLSLGACARVRSSPRVNTTKARTIRLRISKVQNKTLNLH